MSFYIMTHTLDVTLLPDVVLEKILLNLSYDEIAHLRVVCKRFDYMCKQILNKGFVAAERYHSSSLKAVKVLLPRRESERRLHPMSRHCDILTAIETRLSMLSMTFMKYVDLGLCCFIPGKVLDEIFRVLRFLKDCKAPPRAHEILQELRDISSMAMEHFDEKIAPELKSSRSFASAYPGQGSCGIMPRKPIFTQEKLRLEFQKFKCREQKVLTLVLSLKAKVREQNHRLHLQSKKILSQARKISKHEKQVKDMRRSFGELEIKFNDVVSELSCIRGENEALASALGVGLNRSCTLQVPTEKKPVVSLGENLVPPDVPFKRTSTEGNKTINADINRTDTQSCEEDGRSTPKRETNISSPTRCETVTSERNTCRKAGAKQLKSACMKHIWHRNLSASDDKFLHENSSFKQEAATVPSASDMNSPDCSQTTSGIACMKHIWHRNLSASDDKFLHENSSFKQEAATVLSASNMNSPDCSQTASGIQKESSGGTKHMKIEGERGKRSLLDREINSLAPSRSSVIQHKRLICCKALLKKFHACRKAHAERMAALAMVNSKILKRDSGSEVPSLCFKATPAPCVTDIYKQFPCSQLYSEK